MTDAKDCIVRDRDPLDEYELYGALGEGSYGAVWKGKKKTSGEMVAIKIIPFDNGDDSDLKREIHILEQARDDFVIGYHNSYEKEQNVWIVMELAEAGSVNDVMQICDVALEEGLIKILIASCLLGLEFLHTSKHMIHRDIKAGNILLTRSGQAKLADFGVSATLNSQYSKRNTVIGTPFWMAPEVIQETQYDYKADIWSLGITLIELADREPPFANIHPMRAIFMIPSRPPPTLHNANEWSKDMVHFLSRALVKNPTERATARELMDHPFVSAQVRALDTASPQRGVSLDLKELFDSCIQEIIEFRELEANKLAQQVETIKKQTQQQQHNTAILMGGGTSTVKTDFSTTANAQATMVPSGTMIGGSTLLSAMDTNTMMLSPNLAKDTPNSQPDFMAYFQTSPNVQLDKQETEHLKKNLSRLDSQFKNDINLLRKQYLQRKQALMTAAGISNQ